MTLYYKIISLFFFLLIDGFTKFYAESGKISFNIANFLVYKFSLNAGISFNLLSDLKYIVVVFQIIILFSAIIFLKHTYKNNYGFWLVICGGVGNIIYRFLPGVDFMVVDFISVKNLFICNLADIYIFVGVVHLLVNSLKRKSPKRGFF